MKRKFRSPTPDVPEEYLAYFEDRAGRPVEFFFEKDRGAAWWEYVRENVLARWPTDKPGTRPRTWWMLDAPEPRRRLGGVGTPCHEVLAHALVLDRGIPTPWVSEWDVAYYNGRARDVHGQPIETKYSDGHFPHPAIDPSNPPRYESQAAYLRRLALLLPGELERIPVDAFEDELVLPDGESSEPADEPEPWR